MIRSTKQNPIFVIICPGYAPPSEESAGTPTPRIMKLQKTVAQILQSKQADYFVLFFIVITIAAVIAGSFRELGEYIPLLFSLTYFSSFVFLIEYAARLYSAPSLHPSMRPLKARLRYVFSFYGFVDFVAMLPCIVTYAYWNTPTIHIIILPYIFIIFKLIRHSRSFRLIGMALVSVRHELMTAYTACFITISFAATLMYFIERVAQPEAFANIGDGMWWAVVTFTTTGYGDIYPITPLGKLLGGFLSLIGIAMIAIPTAIISSSFISIMQKRENERQRKADPAHEARKAQDAIPADRAADPTEQAVTSPVQSSATPQATTAADSTGLKQ